MKTGLRLAAFAVALVAFGAIVTVGPRLVSRAEASPASYLAQASALSLGTTRPAGEFPLLLVLNGEPKSGTQVTTSTGADVDMTVTAGKAWVISCTTDAVFLPGTSVTTSTGQSVFAGQNHYLLTGTSTTKLSFLAKSSAGTCNGNELQ